MRTRAQGSLRSRFFSLYHWMQSSSVTSLLERCQMGIMLLMVSFSVTILYSYFGEPSSFFSPVS